jgi:hypothetical protein
MQVWLVDPAKGPQIGAERRPCPFAGRAVDRASALTIVIASPFMHSVADRCMRRMTTTIARPCIGVASRARNRDVGRDPIVTGVFGRVVAAPETARARVPRDDADDGGTIVGAGPVPVPRVGAPPGRLLGVRRGRAFVPPRSGTVRRPHRRCRSSGRLAQSRSDGLGAAAAGSAAACVRHLMPARGVPWARPWRCRAATGPRSRGAVRGSRRPSRSAGCHHPRRPDSDRLESDLGRGTGAVRHSHSAGMSAPGGGGDVLARGCRDYRPSARRSASHACGDDSTPRTVATHEPPMAAIANKYEVKNPVCSQGSLRGEAFTAARSAFGNEIKCCHCCRALRG